MTRYMWVPLLTFNANIGVWGGESEIEWGHIVREKPSDRL